MAALYAYLDQWRRQVDVTLCSLVAAFFNSGKHRSFISAQTLDLLSSKKIWVRFCRRFWIIERLAFLLLIAFTM
jgi:hypothetical protein